MTTAGKQADGRGLLPEVERSVKRAQDFLLGLQYPEGYWWGELESNCTMEAEFIMLTHFLGAVDRRRERKLVNYILSKQREDGTWGQYYGAPGDLNTTTECYFALKLAGVSAQEPFMRKARDFVLSKGGVPRTRVFTKIWLALFGQWEWRGVPVMPPELVLLPRWAPFNIYDFSSWARATIVPLLVLMDRKPVKPVPAECHIDELYPRPRSETDYSIKRPKRLVGWEGFFYAGDLVLRLLERLPVKPTRGQALRRAEQWILDHQERDGSWGGIQPPWVYSLMALHSLGYPLDHPVMKRGLEGFETFIIEDAETLRVQACVSPVWDTCLAMIGLLDSGLAPDHPALVKAARWLLDREVRKAGDWHIKVRDVPPGGWAFEFCNDTYPDIDDTAEVVMALDRVRTPFEEEKQGAIQRAVRWVLAMQSSDGGWAAFDKDNTRIYIAKIPFADFGETIDPPSVDVTAHVVEMLGQLGYPATHPSVDRALEYMLAEQEADGSWFGRWGVNYIYGTGAVLPALASLGLDMRAPYVRRAVAWLQGHQNDDGGWGESCASYVDPAYRGRGPSTASQTAWALMALLAAEEVHHPATARGVRFLMDTQRPEGGWDEPWFTGTGFPGYGIGQRLDRFPPPDDPDFQGTELSAGFMINYHMYRHYWPLMALGRYRRLLRGEGLTLGRRAQVPLFVNPRPRRRRRLKRLLPLW